MRLTHILSVETAVARYFDSNSALVYLSRNVHRKMDARYTIKIMIAAKGTRRNGAGKKPRIS